MCYVLNLIFKAKNKLIPYTFQKQFYLTSDEYFTNNSKNVFKESSFSLKIAKF